MKKASRARKPAARLVNQKTLCELLDTSRKIVGEWETAGMPFTGERTAKRYDLARVMPWLKDRWLGGGDDTGGGSGGDDLPSKRSAEIKVLIAREAAIQLKMKLASGQWVDRDEVRRMDIKKIHATRAGLEALHRHLAPAIVELGSSDLDEVERLIADHTRNLLWEMAGGGGGQYPPVKQKRGEL